VLKKWVIIMGKKQTSGLSAQDNYYARFRGRCEEMAWKRRRVETSVVIVIFNSTCVDRQHTYRHQKYPLGWVKTG